MIHFPLSFYVLLKLSMVCVCILVSGIEGAVIYITLRLLIKTSHTIFIALSSPICCKLLFTVLDPNEVTCWKGDTSVRPRYLNNYVSKGPPPQNYMKKFQAYLLIQNIFLTLIIHNPNHKRLCSFPVLLSSPLLSMGDWFQDPTWIPKSVVAQVSHIKCIVIGNNLYTFSYIL